MTDIPSHINRIKAGAVTYATLLERSADEMFQEAKQQYEETMQLVADLRKASELHAAEIHERFIKNTTKNDGSALEAVERELANAKGVTRQ